MNFQEKLEEIRQKPEHIKLRYVYGAVTVSMFFIILLWFFSLADTFKKADLKNKQNVFEGLEKEKKSIKESTDNLKKSMNNLNTSLENAEKELQAEENQTENSLQPTQNQNINNELQK